MASGSPTAVASSAVSDPPDHPGTPKTPPTPPKTPFCSFCFREKRVSDAIALLPLPPPAGTGGLCPPLCPPPELGRCLGCPRVLGWGHGDSVSVSSRRCSRSTGSKKVIYSQPSQRSDVSMGRDGDTRGVTSPTLSPPQFCHLPGGCVTLGPFPAVSKGVTPASPWAGRCRPCPQRPLSPMSLSCSPWGQRHSQPVSPVNVPFVPAGRVQADVVLPGVTPSRPHPV